MPQERTLPQTAPNNLRCKSRIKHGIHQALSRIRNSRHPRIRYKCKMLTCASRLSAGDLSSITFSSHLCRGSAKCREEL